MDCFHLAAFSAIEGLKKGGNSQVASALDPDLFDAEITPLASIRVKPNLLTIDLIAPSNTVQCHNSG